MSDSVFGPVHWAMNVPPMLRRDGNPDDTAHHVLLVLATFANRDGTSARPSVATLAKKAYKHPRVTADALVRIEAAGLISKSADLNGTTVWRLHLEVSRIGPTVIDQKREREREKAAERQRRRRERIAESMARHAPAERDVTHPQSVTATPSVTHPESVSHAPAERESRTRRACVTHPPALLPQVSSGVPALDQPVNCQTEKDTGTSYRADAEASRVDQAGVIDAEIVDDDGPVTASLFPAVENSVAAKPKPARKPRTKKEDDPEKQEKERQAKYLADRYYEAKNKMVKFMAVRQVIVRALENYSYEKVRAGVHRMTTVDRDRTLTLETLRTAIERAAEPQRQQAGGEYANQTDANIARLLGATGTESTVVPFRQLPRGDS